MRTWSAVAVSCGLLSVSCCGSMKPRHGTGFYSTLPGPGDGLGDRAWGVAALAIMHDINPYLAFIPIDDTGPPRAARLVVVSTKVLASVLAWEVRHTYMCGETKEWKSPKLRRLPTRTSTRGPGRSSTGKTRFASAVRPNIPND